MAGACEERYRVLTANQRCAEDVAADRTFDALRAALGEVPGCYDPRDRLFEQRLRAIATKGERL